MKLFVLSTTLTLASTSAVAMAQVETEHQAWSYTTSSSGPTQWGKLSADYRTCATGRLQSPIDIRDALKTDLPPLKFDYRPGPAQVLKNGHAIQVSLTDAGSVMLAGKAYRLEQFHFHSPGEERIQGHAYPLSAHLLHRNDSNELAVVAILFEEGAYNTALTPILTGMPKTAGTRKVQISFNPTDLLPTQQSYYNYTGSLTTPPCSEPVHWYIMRQPMSASKKQLEHLRALYPMNARPVQPLNGRDVYIGG